MRCVRNIAAALFGLAFAIAAQAAPVRSERHVPFVRILLVGDSTMATGNGWGDAFCSSPRRTSPA